MLVAELETADNTALCNSPLGLIKPETEREKNSAPKIYTGAGDDECRSQIMLGIYIVLFSF